MLGSTAAPPRSPYPPPVDDPDAGVSSSLAGTTPPPVTVQHAPVPDAAAVPDAAPVQAAAAAPVRVPRPSQNADGNSFFWILSCQTMLILAFPVPISQTVIVFGN
jgi:hypothetical protein